MIGMGFIGTGYMARVHMKMFAESSRAKVACICSRNEDAVRELAGELGCGWTTDYRKLLEREDVDAVSIGTPNPQHYAMAMEALKAGKHVAVQYPITQTAAEFDELVKEAEKRGLVLHHSLTPVIEPPPAEMEKLLGSIGKLMMLRSVYIGGGSGSWYLDEKARGNFYSAFTIHQITYENRLLKEQPDWVFGALNYKGSSNTADDSVRHSGSYMAHYPSGIISYNEWGMGYSTPTWTWTAEGENGRLVFEMGSDDNHPDTITILTGGKVRVVELPSRMEGHIGEVKSFISQVLDGQPSYTSCEMTRSILRTCEAAMKSAVTGEKVKIC